MSKTADKRIELARRVLDTTDTKTLTILEHVLSAGELQQFSEPEIDEFKAISEGMRNGTIKSIPWSEVKAKALQV